MYKKASEVEADLMKKNPKTYVSIGRKHGTKNKIGARRGGYGSSDQITTDDKGRGSGDIWFLILKYASPFTVLVFLVLGLAMFISGLNNINDLDQHVTLLQQMTTVNKLNNELAYYAKLYELYIFYVQKSLLQLPQDKYLTLDEVKERMMECALRLHNITITGIFQKHSKFLDWQGTSLTTFLVMHDKGKMVNQWEQNPTIVEAINGYATDLQLLSGLNELLSTDNQKDIITQTLMNGPVSIDQTLKVEISNLIRALTTQNNSTMVTAIIMAIVGGLLTFVIIVVVYVLLKRLNTQRNDALLFFLSIKLDVTKDLLDRLEASEDLDRGELTDEEKMQLRAKKRERKMYLRRMLVMERIMQIAKQSGTDMFQDLDIIDEENADMMNDGMFFDGQNPFQQQFPYGYGNPLGMMPNQMGYGDFGYGDQFMYGQDENNMRQEYYPNDFDEGQNLIIEMPTLSGNQIQEEDENGEMTPEMQQDQSQQQNQFQEQQNVQYYSQSQSSPQSGSADYFKSNQIENGMFSQSNSIDNGYNSQNLNQLQNQREFTQQQTPTLDKLASSGGQQIMSPQQNLIMQFSNPNSIVSPANSLGNQIFLNNSAFPGMVANTKQNTNSQNDGQAFLQQDSSQTQLNSKVLQDHANRRSSLMQTQSSKLSYTGNNLTSEDISTAQNDDNQITKSPSNTSQEQFQKQSQPTQSNQNSARLQPQPYKLMGFQRRQSSFLNKQPSFVQNQLQHHGTNPQLIHSNQNSNTNDTSQTTLQPVTSSSTNAQAVQQQMNIIETLKRRQTFLKNQAMVAKAASGQDLSVQQSPGMTQMSLMEQMQRRKSSFILSKMPQQQQMLMNNMGQQPILPPALQQYANRRQSFIMSPAQPIPGNGIPVQNFQQQMMIENIKRRNSMLLQQIAQNQSMTMNSGIQSLNDTDVVSNSSTNIISSRQHNDSLNQIESIQAQQQQQQTQFLNQQLISSRKSGNLSQQSAKSSSRLSNKDSSRVVQNVNQNIALQQQIQQQQQILQMQQQQLLLQQQQIQQQLQLQQQQKLMLQQEQKQEFPHSQLNYPNSQLYQQNQYSPHHQLQQQNNELQSEPKQQIKIPTKFLNKSLLEDIASFPTIQSATSQQLGFGTQGSTANLQESTNNSFSGTFDEQQNNQQQLVQQQQSTNQPNSSLAIKAAQQQHMASNDQQINQGPLKKQPFLQVSDQISSTSRSSVSSASSANHSKSSISSSSSSASDSFSSSSGSQSSVSSAGSINQGISQGGVSLQSQQPQQTEQKQSPLEYLGLQSGKLIDQSQQQRVDGGVNQTINQQGNNQQNAQVTLPSVQSDTFKNFQADVLAAHTLVPGMLQNQQSQSKNIYIPTLPMSQTNLPYSQNMNYQNMNLQNSQIQAPQFMQNYSNIQQYPQITQQTSNHQQLLNQNPNIVQQSSSISQQLSANQQQGIIQKPSLHYNMSNQYQLMNQSNIASPNLFITSQGTDKQTQLQQFIQQPGQQQSNGLTTQQISSMNQKKRPSLLQPLQISQINQDKFMSQFQNLQKLQTSASHYTQQPGQLSSRRQKTQPNMQIVSPSSPKGFINIQHSLKGNVQAPQLSNRSQFPPLSQRSMSSTHDPKSRVSSAQSNHRNSQANSPLLQNLIQQQIKSPPVQYVGSGLIPQFSYNQMLNTSEQQQGANHPPFAGQIQLISPSNSQLAVPLSPRQAQFVQKLWEEDKSHIVQQNPILLKPAFMSRKNSMISQSSQHSFQNDPLQPFYQQQLGFSPQGTDNLYQMSMNNILPSSTLQSLQAQNQVLQQLGTHSVQGTATNQSSIVTLPQLKKGESRTSLISQNKVGVVQSSRFNLQSMNSFGSALNSQQVMGLPSNISSNLNQSVFFQPQQSNQQLGTVVQNLTTGVEPFPTTNGGTYAEVLAKTEIDEFKLKKEALDKQMTTKFHIPQLILPDLIKKRKRRVFQNAVPLKTILIIISLYCILVLALLLETFIVLLGSFSMESWPTRIGLSGLRASNAHLLPILSLQLLQPSQGVIDDSFELRTQPKWRGLEHMYPKRSKIIKVFGSILDYIKYIHEICIFGDTKDVGDEVLDPQVVYESMGLSSVMTYLFGKGNCFLHNQTLCEQRPNRMPTTAMGRGEEVNGLEQIILQVFYASQTIVMKGFHGITPQSQSMILINSALVWDLGDGLETVTEMLANLSFKVLKQMKLFLIIVGVFNLILILVLFAYLFFHIQSQLDHVQFKTARIRELLPVEETMAVRWSKQYNIGDAKMDEAHHDLIEAASKLLDHLIKGEEHSIHQDADLVRYGLQRHLREELRFIQRMHYKQYEKFWQHELNNIAKQFSHLLNRYDEGVDIKEAMVALFDYIINIHILEDDRTISEMSKAEQEEKNKKKLEEANDMENEDGDQKQKENDNNEKEAKK